METENEKIPVHNDERAKARHADEQATPAHDDERATPAHDNERAIPAHDDERAKARHADEQAIPAHDNGRAKAGHADEQTTPSHDDERATADDDERARTKTIYRATIIGALGNVALLIFKFVAGFVGHSAAMIADAVHSLTDFITDAVVLMFVKLSARPQDKDHNYGHGKYETLATAIIGIILLGVGVLIAWNAGERIWRSLHGETLEAPGAIALIAALVSIAVKEALYQYTVRVGRRVKSKVVEANAWHHRSDSLSSIATAIGIGGAMLLGAKWRILDPIAAILVSLLILKVAVKLFIPAVDELLEKSLPEAEEKKILEIVGRFPQVESPHNLRTRRVGASRSIELHLRLPDDMTVKQSHEITREIEQAIRAELGRNTYINLHVEPRSH